MFIKYISQHTGNIHGGHKTQRWQLEWNLDITSNTAGNSSQKRITVFNVSASVLKDNFMLTETERKKVT